MITRTTNEPGLRRTVATVDVSALRATLACVARVNPDYLATNRLSLVFKKAFELGKRPPMKAAFRFPSVCLNSGSEVREIFNDNNRSGFDAAQYLLAKNVVAIASEPLAAARKVSQMPLGGLRTVRLQFSAKSEGALLHFAPVFLTVHPRWYRIPTTIRSHGRTANAEVNAEGLTVRDKGNIGQFDNDVEGKSVFPIHKVSGTNLRARKTFRVSGKNKRNLNSSSCCGKVRNSHLPVQFERVNIIARRAKRGVRTANRPSFFANVIADLTASVAFCRACT